MRVFLWKYIFDLHGFPGAVFRHSPPIQPSALPLQQRTHPKHNQHSIFRRVFPIFGRFQASRAPPLMNTDGSLSELAEAITR